MKLTVNEAAALLGKSPRMIRHLAQNGGIPAERMGNRWVFDREKLTAADPDAALTIAETGRIAGSGSRRCFPPRFTRGKTRDNSQESTGSGHTQRKPTLTSCPCGRPKLRHETRKTGGWSPKAPPRIARLPPSAAGR